MAEKKTQQTEEVNAAFIEALGELVATPPDDIEGLPLVVQLVDDPFLPDKLRIYTDQIRRSGSGRPEDEYNVEPDMPDYFDGVGGDSGISEERIDLLAGYDPDREVFVFWDLDLYESIERWGTVYVKEYALEGACEEGIGRQQRHLKHSGKGETVLASVVEKFENALREYVQRVRIRPLINEEMPDDWDDGPRKQRQIEDTVLIYLAESPYHSISKRRADAQSQAARRYDDRDLDEFEVHTETDLWTDSPDGDGSPTEALEHALNRIEQKCIAGAEQEDSTGRASSAASVNTDHSIQVPNDEWTAPDSGFASTETPPPLDQEFYFPSISGDESSLAEQIHVALRNGNHLILTGPPGSGKTEIAKAVCDHYVDDYALATATDDWSTFDTIGGYRPQSDNKLEFEPGIFLQRFLDPDVCEAENEWLVIDELNRADVDKAFGSLFSALTGNKVTLPFDTQKGQVTLVGDPAGRSQTPLTGHHYYVPEDWRLIATMNTDDKSSLYRLSYAFMRRFAFVSVPVPDEITSDRIAEYVARWEPEFPDEEDWPEGIDDLEGALCDDLATLWAAVQDVHPIGPGLIEDVLNHVLTRIDEELGIEYGAAVAAHVLPQLDGARKRQIETILDGMDEVEQFDRTAAERFAAEYLDVNFSLDG